MEKILITGGAGFIGYHLAKELVKTKHVYILDDFSKKDSDDKHFRELQSHENIKMVHNMSLCDDYFYQFIDTDISKIYHLAAINGTNNFYLKPYEVLKNNIDGTIKLLEWVKKSKCKKILFTSTCETYYGTINKFMTNTNKESYIPTSEKIPLTIDDIYNERTSYAISKIACESLIINFCKKNNLDYNIVRYHNIYGERMGIDGHVIPDIIMRLFNDENKYLALYGSDCTRSFCYIKNAVRDTIIVMNGVYNGTYNIGSEYEILIEDLARMLLHIAKKEWDIIDHGKPKGSVSVRVPSMKKFRNDLGTYEYTDLYRGLRKTFKWYEQNYKGVEMSC